MTLAINLDPDEGSQNWGPHVRYKLFDDQIIILEKLGKEALTLINSHTLSYLYQPPVSWAFS